MSIEDVEAMNPMTWADELECIMRIAYGDVGLYTALVALRGVENGRPGREFGVLSVTAPTYADQLRVACNTIKHHMVRAIDKGITPRDHEGFFTDEFLKDFSARWAPVGAENDPNNLNANHARNLCLRVKDYRGLLLTAMDKLYQ